MSKVSIGEDATESTTSQPRGVIRLLLTSIPVLIRIGCRLLILIVIIRSSI